MLKAIEILKAKKQVLESNLKDRIKNSYNLQYEDDNQITSAILEELKYVDEAIEDLEQYEQKFKEKEFKYRTDCQNILSAGRVEADNMPDRLAELEKVILDYYLAKGYEVGVGYWAFNVKIDSDYKDKNLEVSFYNGDGLPYSIVFTVLETNTKEMFDKAIEFFRSGK